MELCDVILRTNRVRCALNMEILDLLNEESVSGAHSGRAKIRREVLLRMFEKVSQSLKYDSNIVFCPQTHNIYICMDTSPVTLTPLALCLRGNNVHFIILSMLHY